MRVYLDNSATTRVDSNVIELMAKVMGEDYGNPSSKHAMGVSSEKYIKEAAKTIAGILKVSEKEIIFTSGGTESNNLAIKGAALGYQRNGKHIITSSIEHDSVSRVMMYLKEQGFEITYLDVDSNGLVNKEQLKSSIRPDTILVSIMYVNNEIGSVQDIAEIGALIKEANPETVFHVDAVQAFGKMNIYPRRAKIDLLSVSSHKIHGPKGVGFLYIRDKLKVRPQMLGGGQQRGMRSGTDNVPGVAGMALAAENSYKRLENNTAHMEELRDRLSEGLIKLDRTLDGVHISLNNNSESRAPHIVSATFLPVKSEVLLHALEDKGIYVSAGSACASNRQEKSHTLKSIGLDETAQDCTLRFSLCRYNTEEEIDYTLKCLEELLPVLAKFVSK